MRNFPELDIPDFYSLSKKLWWDPKLYQPVLYNEKVKYYSENLKPGTLDFDDFWDEMDYYCYNGYQVGKMPRISGRHFYYLNFNKIMALRPGWKRKRLTNPFYRDLDHYIFLEIEAAVNHGYGLIIGKPRRIGLSEIGALNFNYEHTFFEGNILGACAGKDDKVAEFRQKIHSSLNNVHPHYRNGVIKNNDDLLYLGYTDVQNKQSVDCGIKSISRYKTMYADSSSFEGGSYSMVIFEEIGQFQNLAASYAATKPCFMEGNHQFGTPLLYGTGGEIDKGASGFATIWNESEIHNLKKIFIPAYYYYPGDGIPDEKTGKVVSFFDYNRGVTNRKEAKRYIEEERKIAAKSQETYIKHIQSYPLHPKEMFLRTEGGILDLRRLNYQLQRINNGEATNPVIRGRLDWEDTPLVKTLLMRAKTKKERCKIRVENNIGVKFVEDPNGSVWIDSNPINKQYSHLSYKPDIGGGDSYDDSTDEKNKRPSYGSVVAYRCYSSPSRDDYDKPVGLLLERGDGSYDDDTFYENAVKFAIFWDMEILFEHTKTHIIRYFYDVGADKYLRGKPNLDVTENHSNKVGVKMPGPVKSALIKELKREVDENIHKNFFGEIILDMVDFGEKNTDITMAYGIALLHRMDLFGDISYGIEFSSSSYEENLFSIPQEYYVDNNGVLRINTFGENDQVDVFIPERDLSPYEYERYMEKRINKTKESLNQFNKEVFSEKNSNSSIVALIEEERNRFQKMNNRG